MLVGMSLLYCDSGDATTSIGFAGARNRHLPPHFAVVITPAYSVHPFDIDR